ncbi:MAG TPA: DUF4147 domain-containing protein, partial [Terriglobales bacterium]
MPRHALSAILEATLTRLSPERLTRAKAVELLRASPAPPRAGLVIALGKAAAPMLAGWRSAGLPPWPTYVSAPHPAPGAPAAPSATDASTHSFCGGHPLPNSQSLTAAEAMLAAARALAADSEPARLVALISGGGSALAELPR